MKPIKAKILCSYNGVWYEAGDEIKVETKEDLVKLNEKGFIDKNTLRIVDYNQVYKNNQETNRNNANLDCQYQFGNNQIYFQPNNQNGYQQYPMNNNNMNQVVEMGFVNNQMGNYYMNQH